MTSNMPYFYSGAINTPLSYFGICKLMMLLFVDDLKTPALLPYTIAFIVSLSTTFVTSRSGCTDADALSLIIHKLSSTDKRNFYDKNSLDAATRSCNVKINYLAYKWC